MHDAIPPHTAVSQRGKRFRKLIRLLSNAQAVAVMRRFKLHTLLSVAALFVVHLACFAAILVMVLGLQDNVLDLNNSGERNQGLRLGCGAQGRSTSCQSFALESG